MTSLKRWKRISIVADAIIVGDLYLDQITYKNRLREWPGNIRLSPPELAYARSVAAARVKVDDIKWPAASAKIVPTFGPAIEAAIEAR